MSGPDGGGAEAARIPRRDWILLPLVGLLTIAAAATSFELVARHFYTRSAPFIESCLGSFDPSTGGRPAPRSVCREKKYESQLVEYRFNSCGHRMDTDCTREKQPSTYRIVMVGSSVAMGGDLAREQTFAALLPAELSARTHRAVEVYNEGLVTIHPHALAMRFDEVLAAQPDMILWILTPLDIQNELLVPERQKLPEEIPAAEAPPGSNFWSTVRFRVHDAFARRSILGAFQDLWARAQLTLSRSASGTLLLHWMYESPAQYVRSSLAAADDSGFLRASPDFQWQRRLRYFDDDDASIEERARKAGVPVVTVLVPNRAQAAIISMGHWPAGIDPYRLDRDLRAVVTSHGGSYIEISHDFREIPNAEQYYFPVDNHPDARGHEIITALLAKALTDGPNPELAIAPQPRVAQRRDAQSPIR